MPQHFDDMKYLKQHLIKIGLSNLEAQVYLGLLEREKTTAGALAKHLGIKRSTSYTILESLIKKGLCRITKIEHVKHFQAEPPARLHNWIDEQKNKLAEKESLLDEISADLQKLSEHKLSPPEISIYEGKKGVQSLLMDNLDESPNEVIVIGGYMEDQDLIPEYTKRRVSMKIPAKVIVPNSPYAQESQSLDAKENRETTIIKSRFPASFHIYEDSISIFTFSGENPVGVHIKNNDICETMKMIFQIIKKNTSK